VKRRRFLALRALGGIAPGVLFRLAAQISDATGEPLLSTPQVRLSDLEANLRRHVRSRLCSEPQNDFAAQTQTQNNGGYVPDRFKPHRGDE
jgi:hypothetical protein